jgi:hypothetical protein
MRAYLDARMATRIQAVMPVGVLTARYKRGIGVNDRDGGVTGQAYPYYEAYELLGDKKYLQVVMDMAEFTLRTQQPKGYWTPLHIARTDGTIGLGNPETYCRFQDGFQIGRFRFLLYVWRVTGEKKYLDAAIRNADYVLSCQNDNGSWPDYWVDGTVRGDRKRVSGWEGVLIGGSYNDGATTLPMMQMLCAYHLTKDPKYLAKIGRIGQWMFDTQIGEGKVRGWCQQYGLDNKPIAARSFEMAAIEPRTFNRFIVPMCTWFYVLTGEDRYMTLLAETVAWMESVKKPAPNKPGGGWAYQYLPDGTPAFPWNYKMYRYDSPETWPKGETPEEVKSIKSRSQHGSGKTGTSGAESVLKLWREGGRDAVARSLTGPVELSPEAYLDARIAAARRALDAKTLATVRARPLAKADPDRPLGTRDPEINAQAAVQWRFLQDVRIAQGKFTALDLARGAPPYCGGDHMHAYKVADWLALPKLPD